MRDDDREELLIAAAPRLLGLTRRLAPRGIDAITVQDPLTLRRPASATGTRETMNTSEPLQDGHRRLIRDVGHAVQRQVDRRA